MRAALTRGSGHIVTWKPSPPSSRRPQRRHLHGRQDRLVLSPHQLPVQRRAVVRVSANVQPAVARHCCHTVRLRVRRHCAVLRTRCGASEDGVYRAVAEEKFDYSYLPVTTNGVDSIVFHGLQQGHRAVQPHQAGAQLCGQAGRRAAQRVVVGHRICHGADRVHAHGPSGPLLHHEPRQRRHHRH